MYLVTIKRKIQTINKIKTKQNNHSEVISIHAYNDKSKSDIETTTTRVEDKEKHITINQSEQNKEQERTNKHEKTQEGSS